MPRSPLVPSLEGATSRRPTAGRDATVYGNELGWSRDAIEALMRVGTGFDLHRLVVGRRLVLGGVELPWDMGVDGHSDADVICTALRDEHCGTSGICLTGSHVPSH